MAELDLFGNPIVTLSPSQTHEDLMKDTVDSTGEVNSLFGSPQDLGPLHEDNLTLIRNKSDVREHGKSLPVGLVYNASYLEDMIKQMAGRPESDIPLSDDYWALRAKYHNSGKLEE